MMLVQEQLNDDLQIEVLQRFIMEFDLHKQYEHQFMLIGQHHCDLMLEHLLLGKQQRSSTHIIFHQMFLKLPE